MGESYLELPIDRRHLSNAGGMSVFATAIWAPVSLQSWKNADDTVVPCHLVLLKSQI
jgi:hypothetical protein